ncbi:MAG: hypothetical protein IKB38_02495 [Clostridia bacterium]|nr:hypothetical protein [Clostridia bacterium]
MNEELKLHIKKLQMRTMLYSIAELSVVISIGFGILFLFVPSVISTAFFAVASGGIIYIVHVTRVTKREAEEIIYKPVIFNADNIFSFEKIVNIFKNLTVKENQLSISEDLRFFLLTKIFILRTVIYRTDMFDKKDFDNAKNQINTKANKVLNISQTVNRSVAVKMMRFNIICTDDFNDALYMFISKNANHNLTRVEGVINIAIVGNKIIIPPLYGECDLSEVSRYKRVIKFINNVLLNN